MEVTDEVSVSVEAGFKEVFSASAGYSHAVAEAWETSTSMEMGKATVQSVTEEHLLFVGTRGVLTFIPRYECDMGSSNCVATAADGAWKSWTDDVVNVCYPIKDAEGFPAGEHSVVYLASTQ
jgi:hypothetical protein